MSDFKTIPDLLQNWNDGRIALPIQVTTRIMGIWEDEFGDKLPTAHQEFLHFCLLINYKEISYEFLEFLGSMRPSDLELFFSDTSKRFAKHGLFDIQLSRDQTITCSISAVLYQYLRQSIKDWPEILIHGTSVLGNKVPRSSKDNHRTSIEILTPHVELLARYIISTPKMMDPPARYLDNLERIASLLRLKGDDGDAIKLYGYIHQQNKIPKRNNNQTVHLKLSPARTAELYNNMGLSCLNEGDITFACSCFDKAIATLESAGFSNTTTMLEVIANVARARLDKEDYSAAERLLVRTLSDSQEEGKSPPPGSTSLAAATLSWICSI